MFFSTLPENKFGIDNITENSKGSKLGKVNLESAEITLWDEWPETKSILAPENINQPKFSTIRKH